MSDKLANLLYGSAPRLIKGFFTYYKDVSGANREGKVYVKELKNRKIELPYDIPEYNRDMPGYKGKAECLKPTLHCQSRAPEIIAMANKLGSFQKDNRAYAEACFNFVKRNIELTAFQKPCGAVKTLYSGKGLCLDIVNLFIALCRAGGLPARYVIYSEVMLVPAYEIFTSDNPLLKAWYDSIGYLLMHTSAEVMVNNRWLIGEFVMPGNLEAGLGFPLAHLGDDANGVWCYRMRESTARYESLPLITVIGISLALTFFGGLLVPVEKRLLQKQEEGRKILRLIGEEEYNRRIKSTYKVMLPEISKKLYEAIEMV